MSDWREEAACLNDPIPFDDPDPNDRGPTRMKREADAKEICHTRCYVREECLTEALKYETPSSAYNIRGGMSGDERKALLRKQARERDKQNKREARRKAKETVAA